MTPFKATIFTLFPEIFPGPLGTSLMGKAKDKGLFELELIQIRDYAVNKHKSVDDTPFGGGAGMVMRADIMDAALQAQAPKGMIIYPSPRGSVLSQAKLHEFAKMDHLHFVCGRYEGLDQRVIDKWQMVEISLGDYVVSGGELAVLTMLDGLLRLRPNILGSAESLEEESFTDGLLEYPHYTRPAIWEGRKVPEILTTGDHGAIKNWRLQASQHSTMHRRPDLWQKYTHQNY